MTPNIAGTQHEAHHLTRQELIDKRVASLERRASALVAKSEQLDGKSDAFTQEGRVKAAATYQGQSERLAAIAAKLTEKAALLTGGPEVAQKTGGSQKQSPLNVQA